MSTTDCIPLVELKQLWIYNKHEEHTVVDAMVSRIEQLKMQRYPQDKVNAEIATILSILRRLGYGIAKQEQQA
jgi:hypothetical protein